MQFEQSRVEIVTQISSNWTVTDVQFDNQPMPLGDEYIRPVILDGDSNQISLGPTGLHRRVGVLIIQIFVLKDTGTKRTKELADMLSVLFKSVKLGDTQFESPTLVRVGQNQKYHQENFQVPFYVDIC